MCLFDLVNESQLLIPKNTKKIWLRLIFAQQKRRIFSTNILLPLLNTTLVILVKKNNLGQDFYF